MQGLLVNIDVDDMDRGIAFYTAAFELRMGRRMGADFIELLGAEVPMYLLLKANDTRPFVGASTGRDYGRHWTPVHLDFVVSDLDLALARAERAGARREGSVDTFAYGRIAYCSDPFGNGFCLLQFSEEGYDAITTS